MRRVAWTTGALIVGASAGAFASLGPIGCGSSSGGTPPAPSLVPEGSVADLRDPSSCRGCHGDHYADWAKSMHAYASKDPVFLAMNARGQRETDGGLGTFCVQCHAPMAVKDGLTTNGLNLDTLPDKEKGVTCYFCHDITAVGQTHVNADVTLANDTTMRGPITDPVPNSFHGSAYAKLQDDQAHDASAAMCGNCHDITTQAGAAIERTFEEYQTTVFGGNTSCAASGNCHMALPGQQPRIVGPAGKPRPYHAHDFPAVDIANDPSFPDVATQVATVTSALSNAIAGAVCVNMLNGVRVFLDAQGPGHNFPSGAAQDRRVWVELVAEKNGQPFYTSGQIPAGGVVEPTAADPDIWILRDQMFDAKNQKVSMFWQAACAQGNELPQIQAVMPPPPTHQIYWYPHQGDPTNQVLAQRPDKVTVRVHMQAIGADVLADLVDSGDLSPDAAQVTTFEVGLPSPTDHNTLTLEWTPDEAGAPVPDNQVGEQGVFMTCVSTNMFTISGVAAKSPPATCSTLPPPAPVPDAGGVPVDAGGEDLDAGTSDATTADATMP
jgi:hypothetical protein